MNKAELIDAVSGKTGLQKAEATRAVAEACMGLAA